MFEKGNLVVYGTNGVYWIKDIGAPPDSTISDMSKQYYHLVPIRGNGITYIPIDTKVFIRPVMTKDEAYQLIARIPFVQEQENNSKIQRLLAEQYRSSLESHKTEELICLIKTIYMKNRKLRQAGKRLCQTDERYKKKAEELLYGELSAVLDIPYDHVESYIEQELGRQAGSSENCSPYTEREK
ncbi:CarD family transcriptional regulator [Lachnospiraceae bacterium 62-35]